MLKTKALGLHKNLSSVKSFSINSIDSKNLEDSRFASENKFDFLPNAGCAFRAIFFIFFFLKYSKEIEQKPH